MASLRTTLWAVGPSVALLLPAIVSGKYHSVWKGNFYRTKLQSSLVLGDTLYIDGGEVWNSTAFVAALQSTMLFDLTLSWTLSSVVPAATIDKPKDFPLAKQEYIWYNPVAGRVQVLGGLMYPSDGTTSIPVWSVKNHEVTFQDYGKAVQKLWDFDPNSNKWSKSPNQPPASYLNELYVAVIAASSPNAWHGLGGTGSPYYASVSATYKRFVGFDFAKSKWTNSTSNGYGSSGYGDAGQALYSGAFGDQGVFIYIGGYTPPAGKWTSGENEFLQPMSIVTIYDIGSGTFLTQGATGSDSTGPVIPPPRVYHCIVSASEQGTGTLDIFVFGGVGASKFPPGDINQPYDAYYAGVWILSIPSFVWTFAPNSNRTMRVGHTCQSIGKRQMVVVGGDDPTTFEYGATPDPWPNAIGLFDLSALRWPTRYDPNAAAYKRADVVARAANKTPLPKSWDSNSVRAIFDPAHRSNHSSSNAGNGGGGVNVGAIAGGAVGGFIAVALVALVGWSVWRKKRKAKDAGAASTSSLDARHGPPYESDAHRGPFYEKEARSVVSELKAGHSAHELDADPVATSGRGQFYRT